MKKSVLTSILFFCFTLLVQANGDPTEVLSALHASANPVPRDIVDIQIISEKLLVKPGNYSDIHVKYLLLNTSDKDYLDIDYGFPVDYQGRGDGEHVDDCYSESKYVLGWFDDYIREISFFADGRMLPYKMSEEVIFTPTEPLRSQFEKGRVGDNEYGMEMERFEMDFVSRRWFYTKFSVKAGESLTLEVKYSVRNYQWMNLYLPLYEQGRRYCRLDYDFAPAVHWGNGHAKEFLVEIDTSDIIPGFYDRESEGIAGLPFSRTGDKITYSARNFSFKDAAPLQLRYRLKKQYDFGYIMKHRIPNAAYTITASEAQHKYPVSHLNDVDLTTAWIASKNRGVGATLTIDFNEPTSLHSIFILGAYHKNENTYTQNNRIKKIHIRLIQNPGEESYDDVETDLYYHQDAAFAPLLLEDFPSQSLGYTRTAYLPELKLRRIVLEIVEVYPGSKYEDTCISEIILMGD